MYFKKIWLKKNENYHLLHLLFSDADFMKAHFIFKTDVCVEYIAHFTEEETLLQMRKHKEMKLLVLSSTNIVRCVAKAWVRDRDFLRTHIGSIWPLRLNEALKVLNRADSLCF